jgi:hypothetical protein
VCPSLEQAGSVHMQKFLDELFPTNYAVSNQTEAPNAALVGTRDGMDDQVLLSLALLSLK